MNVTEALEYIHSVSWKGSVPGLSRITRLLGLIGNPQNSMRYVHIVGTNGKGSTAAYISSIMKTAGYTVGMYTSPFIITFNERMQVNGEMISDTELAAITEYIKPFADSMEDRPTEFELITAIAFVYFKNHGCDLVVLEAGMGGEFDATNVIPAPEVAVFTNIGLDHTDFLGDTVEKIAQTKSGILKSGCDCVFYASGDEVTEVIRNKCKSLNIPLNIADFASIQSVSVSLEGQTFNWGKYKSLEVSLLGYHQLCNAVTALTAVSCLSNRGYNVSEANIRQGLLHTSWAGRFEVIGKEPLFIVDGGHNPQCMQALAENIKDYLPDISLTVLTGVLADKDYTAMYGMIAPFVKEFFLVTPPSPRALPAADLKEKLGIYNKPAYVCTSVENGVKAACAAAGKNGTVLAFGSLYMVGDIKNAVSKL